MPRGRCKSEARELAISHTLATGGALLVVTGTLAGITLNNPTLACVCLSIGAGGLLGWTLAGRPSTEQEQ
jgi:hypothetical protein